MNTLVTILRWTARIIGVLAILLFGLLFLQDGLPIFLFGDDDPEMALHMWALLGMLIGLGLGWKWEGLSAALVLGFFAVDELALLVYGLRIGGMPEGLMFPLMTFSFPFVLFPLGGVFHLIGWAWHRRQSQPAASAAT
ncbi:MAG: DUF7670 domain-containing protein [Chloroflexota bacterium]